MVYILEIRTMDIFINQSPTNSYKYLYVLLLKFALTITCNKQTYPYCRQPYKCFQTRRAQARIFTSAKMKNYKKQQQYQILLLKLQSVVFGTIQLKVARFFFFSQLLNFSLYMRSRSMMQFFIFLICIFFLVQHLAIIFLVGCYINRIYLYCTNKELCFQIFNTQLQQICDVFSLVLFICSQRYSMYTLLQSQFPGETDIFCGYSSHIRSLILLKNSKIKTLISHHSLFIAISAGFPLFHQRKQFKTCKYF
eukprot:TRINITY_DN5406_c0_g1_i4.p1 TRINITY_DN5406_c0_g1~~TRINITY_DN5406_c0_g1_i4.p1  ORF type:complete len:251 (-),score=-31.23 TRINITY_DN5406_c0_g1_i4:58-810(-)